MRAHPIAAEPCFVVCQPCYVGLSAKGGFSLVLVVAMLRLVTRTRVIVLDQTVGFTL